jgi:peptidyl-tRNA hydrolase
MNPGREESMDTIHTLNGVHLEAVAADLNAAVYQVVVHHELEMESRELDLGLWSSVVADAGVTEISGPAMERNYEPDPL